MMQEILKPLLENEVLTDRVKESIESALMEAIKVRENKVREEVEQAAKKTAEAGMRKLQETFKTLEESSKAKLNDARIEIELLEAKVSELESRPFVNMTRKTLDNAEQQLVSDLESKFVSERSKYFNAFEIVQESSNEFIAQLLESIDVYEDTIEDLEQQLEELSYSAGETEEAVSEAVERTKRAMRREADARVEKLKENLVTSTEIFLEQELHELKADRDAMMKESQGRELMESLKGIVKQYWDVDSEVAEELLEMKKEAESKVEQYKDMLKREHTRLEESQAMVEKLKKKVIVESKGAVLADDRKQALEKLAENIGSDKLEMEIDSLMESVIDTFNSGFSKKEVASAVKSSNKLLNESAGRTTFSSGDTKKTEKTSEELTELLEFAGIRR